MSTEPKNFKHMVARSTGPAAIAYLAEAARGHSLALNTLKEEGDAEALAAMAAAAERAVAACQSLLERIQAAQHTVAEEQRGAES